MRRSRTDERTNGNIYSASSRRLCVAFFTKYLPTCEFHCWTLDKRNDDTFCRQMTDRLCECVHQKTDLFGCCCFFWVGYVRAVPRLQVCCFAIDGFSFVFVSCVCSGNHLINLFSVRACNFRQTTLLIIKTEIYHTHQIKMMIICDQHTHSLFFLSLSLYSSQTHMKREREIQFN